MARSSLKNDDPARGIQTPTISLRRWAAGWLEELPAEGMECNTRGIESYILPALSPFAGVYKHNNPSFSSVLQNMREMFAALSLLCHLSSKTEGDGREKKGKVGEKNTTHQRRGKCTDACKNASSERLS